MTELDSFDPEDRRKALEQLSESFTGTVQKPWMNMHMHSFFSFNGEAYSPTHLAWEAAKQGLYAIAICDFDVLDGLEELFFAAERLGLRAAAGFETRTFFSEYSDQEINSPGEPGVFYFMGMGFAAPPSAEARAGRFMKGMLDRAHSRNTALIERINSRLDRISVDYEKHVLPLTPNGNATERHIVQAYHDLAGDEFGGTGGEYRSFWASQFDVAPSEIDSVMADINAIRNFLRAKLMKRGGLGYRQPTRDTFPLLDDVIEMILECEAIPMSTWLDGTRAGEEDPESQLECLTAKGVQAVNIIPDRNWNLDDPGEAKMKIKELHRYVAVADSMDLPVNVGTELNKPGLPFVDDFISTALEPLFPTFQKGAQVVIGHSRLLRFADMSYVGQKAEIEFPSREARNEFFAAVGALPSPDSRTLAKLRDVSADEAYSCIRDSVRRAGWL